MKRAVGSSGLGGWESQGEAVALVRQVRHDRRVPRISEFYGIVIEMYFGDHRPRHFRVLRGRGDADDSCGSWDEQGRWLDVGQVLPPVSAVLLERQPELHAQGAQSPGDASTSLANSARSDGDPDAEQRAFATAVAG